MMKIKLDTPEEKAQADMIYVYMDRKMWFNEKSYTMRLIENLYELGYYKNNKSIFRKA